MGIRQRRTAQEVASHGGASRPGPVGPDQGAAPVDPAAPRVETRPEGWRLVDRRGLLKAAGMAAVAAPAAGLLAACGGGSGGGGARKVRIGLVSPRTGALRNFAYVDNFVVGTMKGLFADGMRVGVNTLPVEIFVRDGQSDRNRAAAAATDLIFADKVDIVLVSGTADNVNPVSDICEAQGVPCISTSVPWEAWFYGRGGNPEKSFTWTHHLYWGMSDIRSAYRSMWRALDVPRTVALLLPDDQEGDAFANTSYGLPKLAEDGFDVLGGGAPFRYAVGSGAFNDLMRNVVDRRISIVAGTPNIADFSAFWKLLNEENYRPHVVTLSKALTFPTDVGDLGLAANGFTTEVGWSPKSQFRSSLTNRSAEELVNEYRLEEGRVWSQPLGFTHALFEIVEQALMSVDSIDDRQAVREAISKVEARTIVGDISFAGDPAKGIPRNVATVPLAGGRWTQEGNNGFNLRIVDQNGLNVSPETQMVDLQSISAG
ncbi:ABC transporter substrate-binding protein [Frankia sp. EI5c]|uniref:ABC transporter substrate-binding protein n=1 Tax=Frankia sp. EI5c TaxID=683316 RepID=UPI001F5B41C9|nr:ABC transporter substrate-binding protein [Frankia sp. EI5c]